MSLTLQELNDIRERVRRDRERVARADLQAPGIPAMRSFEAVDREKLLEEVDLLKLEVGALTIELHKAKSEVTRLVALCDAARDKAFSRLDEKAVAFMADTLADQKGTAPATMVAPEAMFPEGFFAKEYPEVPNQVFRPARAKPSECPTCGYTPCQCDQT